MSSHPHPSPPPHPRDEARRPPVLEVRHSWEDHLLDARHYAPGAQAVVSVGTATGWRWRVLGIDLGWVDARWRHVLPFAPPLWSEVDAVPRADFPTPHGLLDDDDVVHVARYAQGRFVAMLPSGLDATIERDAVGVSLDALVASGVARATERGHEVDLDPGVRVAIALGSTHLTLQEVPASARVAGSRRLDAPMLGLTGALGFAAAMLLALVHTSPGGAVVEVDEVPDRIVELALQLPRPEPEPQLVAPAPLSSERGGPRAKRKEGKRGADKPTTKRGKGADAARSNREVVESSGIAGIFRDDGMAALLGDGALDAALDAGSGLTGPRGASLGTGLGRRGDGLGAGGGADLMGDGLGTVSHARAGRPQLAAKRTGSTASISDPIIVGALDRAAIDEVVRRHLSSIRYCYQRALTANPNLAGRVTVEFVIAKDGSVSRAGIGASSLGDPAVERCVEDRFLRMQFPSPRGGGLVVVRYPFVFAS